MISREYILHLNSDLCENINGSSSNILYSLKTPLIALKDEDMYVQFLTASIPLSWYNINSSNAYLSVREGLHTFYSVSIPQGNFNIIQICSNLQDQLNSNSPSGLTYTISYNKFTNKASFTCSGFTTFLFGSGVDAYRDLQCVLGFKDAVDISLPCTSTSICYPKPIVQRKQPIIKQFPSFQNFIKNPRRCFYSFQFYFL